MGNVLYGVDLDGEITPIMVRDAIIVCFKEAHKEILDLMDEYVSWESEEERDRFRDLEIELLIKNAFKDANGNYDNPTKEDLINVINHLAELASKFRGPEIIRKHYAEIKQMIDKLP